MKKILIVNELVVGGGVEKVMEDLVLSLPKKEYQITLAAFFDEKKVAKETFPSIVKYYQLRQAYKGDNYPRRSVRHIFCALRRRFFQKVAQVWFSLQNFDVIIAMKEGSCMELLSKVRAKKRIAWVHTDFETFYWTDGMFSSKEAERLCMAQYDHVICVTNVVAESVKKVVGDPGNLCVRYNPINYENIRTRAQERCALTKTTDGPLFVSVGRLAYPKNYAMLIEACKELSETYAFELWIIGDGPDREELQNMIDSDEIKCVKLLGNKSNPFPYLQQADVFVSSSLSESYGLAIQEAMTLGIPVIAVSCPAIVESMDERFGLLTEPAKESMKNAMEQFLVDPEKIIECRRNIHEYYAVNSLYEERLKKITDLWGGAHS